MNLNLTTLGLGQYHKYDLFESFTGQFIGTYQYTDIYNFTINPAGDVHAFFVEPALPIKRLRSKL